MEPQPTPVAAPIHLRIADDLRMQIERGNLQPGASLRTLADLADQWSCSLNSARGAIALLRSQGLITSGRGKAPTVRVPPRRAVRSSERHQVEKDLALRPESERAAVGEAETNHAISIHEQRFSSHYSVVSADHDVAHALAINVGDQVLRRRYEAVDPQTEHQLSYSVSHIPLQLLEANPALLDENNEPWPGGTQHQLLTVGIEVMCIVDEVTARMPTTVEAQAWDLPDGVPLIFCRRISFDASDRPVEISDAYYPADRTELRFVTPLTPAPAETVKQIAAQSLNAPGRK
jgi:GntR family transcriptional regulator